MQTYELTGIEADMSYQKLTSCPVCGIEIKKTHPMQTLRAQAIYHMRAAHKLTNREALIRWNNK